MPASCSGDSPNAVTRHPWSIALSQIMFDQCMLQAQLPYYGRHLVKSQMTESRTVTHKRRPTHRNTTVKLSTYQEIREPPQPQ